MLEIRACLKIQSATGRWTRMCARVFARVESTRFSDFTTLTCGCYPSKPAHCYAISTFKSSTMGGSVLPIQNCTTMQCNFYFRSHLSAQCNVISTIYRGGCYPSNPVAHYVSHFAHCNAISTRNNSIHTAMQFLLSHKLFRAW